MEDEHVGAAMFTLRAGGNDEAWLRQLYGLLPDSTRASFVPDRLVVDAHVPLTTSGANLGEVARLAGVPFLVDPETYFLQDVQDESASWCKTPFASAQAHTPTDLLKPALQEDLVCNVVDYQLAQGATAVIPPYVHIDRPDDGWVRVQRDLWHQTARYLRQAGINLPVVAVLALGWRCLQPATFRHLGQLWAPLSALDPQEVALAASKSHKGARREERIADLLMFVQRMADSHSVTMWQQGLLGEACVIAGASGYECGAGWRESCDLQSRMSKDRHPRSGHPGSRPVYISALGRSIPKRRLELGRQKRQLWGRLICASADCCPPNGQDLLRDARSHDIVARIRDLRELSATSAINWRWHRIAQRLEGGVALAEQLNSLAPSSSAIPQIDVAGLKALYQVADIRRSRRGRRIRRTA